MAINVLFVLLLASYLTVLECKLPVLNLRVLSIQKFLWTEEQIWTFNTTKPPNNLCQVDELRNMKKTSIYFDLQEDTGKIQPLSHPTDGGRYDRS
uniref:Lipocalin n=1 Tax=Rhipicephalus appendiculatus TaxID=34631 RepID=A0A131YNT9_RHIAP